MDVNLLLEGARVKHDQKTLVTMVADSQCETKAFIKSARVGRTITTCN